LRRACGEVEKKFEGKNGSAYRKLAEKETKIAVRADEVVVVNGYHIFIQRLITGMLVNTIFKILYACL
jgi:hypothetical protein